MGIIKHFEGWHTSADYPYVGYGHRLLPGEAVDADSLTREEGDFMVRKDMAKLLRIFKDYGRDALLLSVLAYNVGAYRLLGDGDIPRSTLIRKLDGGDRDILHEYLGYCVSGGVRVPSIRRRRIVEYLLLFDGTK